MDPKTTELDMSQLQIAIMVGAVILVLIIMLVIMTRQAGILPQ